RAADDIAFAQPGPHIATEGDVSLTAGKDINGGAPLEITATGGAESDDLILVVGGKAVVRVTDKGFLGLIGAVATQPGANIDVRQTLPNGAGDDVIRMAGDGSGGMVVSSADGRAGGVDLGVGYTNPDEVVADGDLLLKTGSVLAGGSFSADSDGDIVLGDANGTVIDASSEAV